MRVRLDHKADPNLRLKKPIIGRHQNLVGDASLAEGATALARAKASDVPVVRLLLDGGADATLTLKDRTTTAMIAASGNPEASALEAVRLLDEHGVDVNAFNANGQTVLHNAAGRGGTRARAVSMFQKPGPRRATGERTHRESRQYDRAHLSAILGSRAKFCSAIWQEGEAPGAEATAPVVFY